MNSNPSGPCCRHHQTSTAGGGEWLGIESTSSRLEYAVQIPLSDIGNVLKVSSRLKHSWPLLPPILRLVSQTALIFKNLQSITTQWGCNAKVIYGLHHNNGKKSLVHSVLPLLLVQCEATSGLNHDEVKRSQPLHNSKHLYRYIGVQQTCTETILSILSLCSLFGKYTMVKIKK